MVPKLKKTWKDLMSTWSSSRDKWINIAGVSSRPQAGALLTRLSFSAHRCHVSGLISKRAAVSAALESLDMQKPQNSKKICMQMRTAHQLNFIPQKQMFEYV